MNMIKELHLVARTIYTFVTILFFSGITGLSLYASFLGIGLTTFSMSFLWQYFVLHFTFKNVVTTPRGRLKFLIGWWVACFAGIAWATTMLPSLDNLPLYDSAEAFAHQLALWGGVLSAFSSAFVAMTCTRRAFTHHGGLG